MTYNEIKQAVKTISNEKKEKLRKKPKYEVFNIKPHNSKEKK